MATKIPRIPSLFRVPFTVDAADPFRRHLNRLEVEIGGEDYRHLKRVELLAEPPEEALFREMEEITERLLATTQNRYNRDLLRRLGVRVYLDVRRYAVYYRLPQRTLRFTPWWRRKVLRLFFAAEPTADSGWCACLPPLSDFTARFVPDAAGGVLLLRRKEAAAGLPLLTATHGPYDPYTLEVTLGLLLSGKGGAAAVNLGFSGREPLCDDNLARLQAWGVPLNPSNIDIIYPYADAEGHPYCYKLEENLRHLVAELEIPPPSLVIDIHGCVGTRGDDERVVVGLGGAPPYPQWADVGEVQAAGGGLHLRPQPRLRQGLEWLRELSSAMVLQFSCGPRTGYLFHVAKTGWLPGRRVDLLAEVASLLAGEERFWLPEEDMRWLPGAGGNALQRQEARRLHAQALCLHVEIPVRIRRGMVLRLQALGWNTEF